MKVNIKVYSKDIEELEEFENIDEFEVNKNGKFLYLYSNCGNGLEWYILHDKIFWIEIEYKGGK